MIPFDFRLPTRIVFGPGRIRELGDIAASLDPNCRALVVSDRGVIDAGHTQRGIDALVDVGVATLLFDQFRENPTTAHVDAGVDAAREFQPNLIIGLGGGSSMDCAKGINF
ncbi:MAG: iron-containing alcohol dehydrogenase, partial [Planctomycetota bacterium]